MPNKLVRFCFVMGAYLIAGADAMAAGASFTRGCAARDMQVLMLIEQSLDRQDFLPQRLDEAVQTMIHARMVCFGGNVSGALEIYDEIARSISLDEAMSTQRRIR